MKEETKFALLICGYIAFVLLIVSGLFWLVDGNNQYYESLQPDTSILDGPPTYNGTVTEIEIRSHGTEIELDDGSVFLVSGRQHDIKEGRTYEFWVDTNYNLVEYKEAEE